MRKHIWTAVAVLLLLITMALPALAKGMTKEQATTNAKKLFRDFPFEVVSVKESELKGLWQVGLVLENRYRILYLSSKGKIAIFPGPETQGHMIELSKMESLTNKATEELGKIDFKTLPLKDAIIMGNKKAKIKVAVFDDPL
jgi:thiol:disulfide interchange protein DsbC